MKTYSDFSDAWFDQLHLTRTTGDVAAPRGLQTVEQRWSRFAVEDSLSFPVQVYGRDLRQVIGVLEGLSLVGQFNVPELFTRRVAKFQNFMDDGIFHGAYSTRAHGAVGDLVSLLERDPDSRQGVISVFDSGRDLDRRKKDIPCTIALHFMRRDDTLELNAIMRSNDVWLGTPYDFVQFAILQASVAQALGLKPGLYVHSADSLHMYDHNSLEASRVTAPRPSVSRNFPLWGCDDDIGSISKRARDLAFGGEGFFPVTDFETWAWTLLHR